MATQPPQSLPSFAQAFGAPSLSRISDASNALPPIHTRASPHQRNLPSPSVHDDHRQSMHHPSTSSSRKRPHPDTPAHDDGCSSGSESVLHFSLHFAFFDRVLVAHSSERRSPKSVRIKEESEHDSLPSPTSRNPPPFSSNDSQHSPPDSAAPPSSKPSPNKKRRVTISGISHPINTDVRTSAPDATKSISPVVMGLPIPRDDVAAIEQVRSMLSIKQQQKELIEQRKGSTAGLVPPSVTVTVVNAPPPQDERQQSSKVPPSRTGVRSPASGTRRSLVGLSGNPPPLNRALSPLARQSSPSSAHPPTQLPSIAAVDQQQSTVPSHALPPPPISFARRRATRALGGGKTKPADIMISPRDANADHLQPSIQSAPPIARGGTNQGDASVRLSSMALPSLPPVLGPGQTLQRFTSSRVPPTPTRLSMVRGSATAAASTHLNVGSISATGRSPPTAVVPIATTLVPPTPSALAHPNYTNERSAFLAPFEMFYDALADSKTLKTWLNEQLQKSHALTMSLQRQQEHVDEIIAAAVERLIGPMQEEIHGLHKRIDDLEHTLQNHSGSGAPRASFSAVQGYSPSMVATTLKGKVKANGAPPPLVGPDIPYTFPPVESGSARSAPPESESRSCSQNGSPVPFDVGRRLSVSAIRLDPRGESTVSHRSSGSIQSHPREREPAGRLPPPPSASTSWNQGRPWSPRSTRTQLPAAPSANVSTSARASHSHSSERPGLVRRSSAQRLIGPGEGYGSYGAHSESVEGRGEGGLRERERERERERVRESDVSPSPSLPSRRDRDVARSPEPMEE